MTVRILTGDCREIMVTLDAESIDACVTDPPYELGFMGQAWDRTGVAFDPDTWRAVLRVLKPGAHLVAFGGTRTYHRMACAIEDAGFEVRDQLAWVYGSGFPKSHNLVGDWAGWGTALKPAWEPIILARKPFRGAVAANVLQHGCGALNIDGCRVLVEGETRAPIIGAGAIPARHNEFEPRAAGVVVAQAHPLGRWPANLMHDGSDEVLACFPDAPGQQADASTSAESRKDQHVYGAMRRGRGDEPSANSANGGDVGFHMRPGARRLDEGSAARFFYCAKADANDRHAGTGHEGPQFKRGATLRDAENIGARRKGNHHPTVKPTDLMRWLCRLVTPPGGLILDPFMGSGSTLKAAELEQFRAIGIELNPEYVEIARRRIAADAPLFQEVA